MENKKGQGIFLGVIGVATLVVTLIGATFAFFSATVTGNAPVNVESYQFAITLGVAPVDPATTPAKGDKLIPLTETDIDKAITAGCVDSNNYAVCKIYELTFVNSGSTAVTLSGGLTSTSNNFATLKYSVTAVGGAKNTLTSGNAVASQGSEVTTGLTNLTIPTGPSTMYLMLYIPNNTTANQPNDQAKSFVGTLTLADTNAASGGKLQATFTTG